MARSAEPGGVCVLRPGPPVAGAPHHADARLLAEAKVASPSGSLKRASFGSNRSELLTLSPELPMSPVAAHLGAEADFTLSRSGSIMAGCPLTLLTFR